MGKSKQDIAIAVAEKIAKEIPHDAKAIASRLWPAVPAGMERLPRAEYIDLIRRHWPDQEFRAKLLQRVGPKNFMATGREVLRPPDEIILGEGPEPVPQEGVSLGRK